MSDYGEVVDLLDEILLDVRHARSLLSDIDPDLGADFQAIEIELDDFRATLADLAGGAP